jgi:alpha-glucuronidase
MFSLLNTLQLYFVYGYTTGFLIDQLCGGVFLMDEYACWLQSRPLDTAVTGTVPGVIFAEGGDAISLQAAGELRRGCMRVLGFSPALFFKTPPDNTGNTGTGRILLGTLPYVRQSCNRSFPPLKSEGFVIRYEGDALIIAGADPSGVLYGVFRFLSLLAQGALPAKLREGYSEAPATRIRMIDHWDDTEGTITRGYAGRSIFWDQGRLSYDSGRIEDYARLLASIGINRLTLNNVNVDEAGMLL